MVGRPQTPRRGSHLVARVTLAEALVEFEDRIVEREGAILVLKPGSRIAPEAGPQVAGQGVDRDLPLFDRLPKKVQEGIGGRGPVVIGELSVLEIILQRAGGGGRREASGFLTPLLVDIRGHKRLSVDINFAYVDINVAKK